MKKKSTSSIRHSIFELFKDAVFYIVGALLYAVSVDVFTAPNDIAPGGVTGIATIINSFYDLPIGSLMLVLNIPLFVLGFIFIGWRYIMRTGVCLVLVSVAIDIFEPILPRYTGNEMLASLFGGVTLGLSLAIIFMRGGSTGGTDIVARIFGKVFPQMTQGKLIMFIDFIVISVAALVYGLESGLFALLALFASTIALDKVLYGMDTGKLLFIITAHPEEVNKGIHERLDRGTTILEGRGGYSGTARETIMCAVRNSEVYRVRAIVRSIDREAFIIVGDASEILGEGFKSIEQNEFGEKDKD